VTGGDLLDAVVARVEVRLGHSSVLAIAGAVAVGKSTIAAEVAARLRSSGATVAIVPTDGFLLPNAELEARDLIARKGFPETYDLDRLAALVADARTGRSPLAVPVYSHERYDVLDQPEVIERPDVLIVEGVVALQRPFADVAVYVEAAVDDVVAWYVARFQDLVVAAEDDPTSFYRGWADLEPPAVAELARSVYDGVNRPNLVDHIAPTRANADVVLHKGQDHAIQKLTWASPSER
jgi:type I pantothenate kinase